MWCPMAVWPPHPESVASCRNETEIYLVILVTLQEPQENNGYWCNLTPREACSISGSVCVISGPQRLTPSMTRGHCSHSDSNILSSWADKFHKPVINSFQGFFFLSYLVFGVKTSGCGPSREVSICSSQRWFPYSVTWVADPGTHSVRFTDCCSGCFQSNTDSDGSARILGLKTVLA